jgi:raffinose/stachyose/melibiose transport system substrate-binding protein
MKRRLISIMMATSIVASLLAGCGSSDVAQQASATDTTEKVQENDSASQAEGTAEAVADPVELTFIFADGDEGAKASINAIVNDFNDQHENITVTVEPGNGGTYSEFLKTKDSVGEFPDVMEMRDTATYVRADKLAPLSDEIVSLFTSAISFGGKVYTAPMSANNTMGVVYNKAYFDANGLTEPKTYDDFIALCEKIKELGDMDPLVVGGGDLWHMGFIFDKAYKDTTMSDDTEFIAKCYEGKASFLDDTFKNSFLEMQEIMQYAQEGWGSTADAQITTFLVNDMAAMIYSGTHMFSTIEEADPDFEYGWFPVPSPDGKLRMVGGGSVTGLAISKESAADPDKLAASEEFIKFFFAPENYGKYCETLNFTPTTVAEPVMQMSDVYQEVLDAVASADTVGPMWNGEADTKELPPDFRNFVYKELIEYLQGTVSLDDACSEIQKTWDVSIQSFNPVTGVGLGTE